MFFVVVGLRTDLSGLTRPGVIGLAAALTGAALAGKQLCALGALAAGSTVDRVAVSLGMIPRQIPRGPQHHGPVRPDVVIKELGWIIH
jgi:Kef-type K+ transport system membrane component KefB